MIDRSLTWGHTRGGVVDDFVASAAGGFACGFALQNLAGRRGSEEQDRIAIAAGRSSNGGVVGEAVRVAPGEAKRADAGGGSEKKRPALVYVPGLDLGVGPAKSIVGVAARIQEACDFWALSRPPTWSVEWHEAALKEGHSSKPAATIVRHDGEEKEAVLDVFEYRWAGALTKRWSAQSASLRAARAGLVLIQAPAFVRFFRTGARKTPKGEIQFAVALALLSIVFLYTAVLVGAAASAIMDRVEETAETTPAPAPSETAAPADPQASTARETPAATTGGEAAGKSRWVQTVVLVVASVQAVFVSPKFRERLGTVGTVLISARNYLRLGDARPEAIHGLTKLMEDIADTYTDVSIVGYSFGSIVALDTIFPSSQEPARSLDSVTKLVTIGAPYDFVQAVQPSWRERRRHRDGLPKEWLNIYAPIDILGSNFRDDDTDGDATTGLLPAEGSTLKPHRNESYDLGVDLTRANILEFYAFRSHGMYWGSDDTAEQNVFGPVVQFLYGGTEILR